MSFLAALVLGTALGPWHGYTKDPRFPWLPSALNLAYREGVLFGYPDDAYMSRRHGMPSRYEYAVVVHAIVQQQISQAQEALKKSGNDLERASLLRCATLLPVYARAGREFRTELTNLGVEGDFGQANLAQLTKKLSATSPARDRLFSDVPVEHWAAKAVGDLRALGLLDGYPDSKFKG